MPAVSCSEDGAVLRPRNYHLVAALTMRLGALSGYQKVVRSAGTAS